MSVWTAISAKLKGILQKMLGSSTIAKELNITPAISQQMEKAINTWAQMYRNESPWLHEPDEDDPVRVVSLGLPAMISSEKARMALLEFESEITPLTEEVEVENPDYEEPKPDEFGNVFPATQPPTIIEEQVVGDDTRGNYLNEQYKRLKKSLRRQLEYGIAKGGLVIKPYVVLSKNDESDGEDDLPTQSTIEFDFVQADCFYPLAFDASGHITEAAFVDFKVEKDVVYRRLEYHKWNGTQVEIINKAFKSTSQIDFNDNQNMTDLGKPIKLTEVPEWANLQEKTIVKNVKKPLFGYFKMPEANTIDTSSPLGVSGFDRAKSLIKDADMQYSRLLWEYEAGEMAVDIDRDAMREDIDRDGNTHTSRPHMQERLFRKVDLGSSGDTYFPYAPSLRDTQYIQGLNTILMRIEDVVAISRGTLSDAAAEARTATELKILKQRSYQSNKEIQDALEDTLRDVAYAMDVYCDLYNLVGDVVYDADGKPDGSNKGRWDISFEWDDSILTDRDEELNKRITLMQNGLTSKLENRMWYFGETEQQAREALAEIDSENQSMMEDELMMDYNRNQMRGGNQK